MSVTQNTLIGRTRGSIGGVTFSSWKGLNVAKSKPISVANPNTTAQQYTRNMMRKAVAAFRLSSDIINLGFRQMAVKMSAYNAFVSANMISGSVNEGQTAPPYPRGADYYISKGTLFPTALTSISGSEGPGSITIHWPTSLSGDQLATDELNIMIQKADGEVIATELAAAVRSAGTAEITVPDGVTDGDDYLAYAFFSQAGSGKCSDNSYNEFAATA